MLKPTPTNFHKSLYLATVLALFPCLAAGQQNRISGRIASSQRFALMNQRPPAARGDLDRGRVDPALKLGRVTLVLKPSDSQQAELDRLLSEQQDPASENYHKWLTPEEYAGRFGASQADLDKIAAWLQEENLTVTAVARGRNAVSVSGTAAEVDGAFGTEIHTYEVDGESHFANSTDPTLPVAMQGIVQAIHGLHDFRPKRRARKLSRLGDAAALRPNYTASSGNHYLGPDDFATIFNVPTLYAAGIDGTGQKIVVVGQSTIDPTHLATFRSYFGLSEANLTTTLAPNTTNPGFSADDAEESDLDLEWASAVARKAQLIFVYSSDVTDAVQYAIDQNLAPVLSMSYGLCETSWGRSGALTLQAWAQQGNAQGITWVAASGDSGAADCYQGSTGGGFSGASSLRAVTDLPASVPEVTGIGGTTFNEGTGTYWNSTHDATTKASALSYIPETAWNDSTSGSPASSGGGASQYFSKPSWQTGTGVASDGARSVPDASFPASPEHDGYLVYTGSGRDLGWYAFGGTSAGAPVFSGVLALLNQHLVAGGYQASSGLGNVNAHLYGFAATTPDAFHDVTSGDNTITLTVCTAPGCASSTTSSVGYSAGTGYDMVTGLGSIDVTRFVSAWHSGVLLIKTKPGMTLSATPASIGSSGTTTVTATVTGSGVNTPTGSVTFTAAGATLGTRTLSGASGTATASITIAGTRFSTGENALQADYGGDSMHEAAAASASVTVVNSLSLKPAISGASNAASFQQTFAPGMVMSLFGTGLALSTRAASSAPLPASADNVAVTVNGIAAPLYYLSPTQINAQVPYETPVGSDVPLVISNNGQTASSTIRVSATAPGIFADSSGALVPASRAKRGETVTLYFTGAGAVSPSVATGAVPASGATPVPVRTTLVTVGGAQASTVYIGVPAWSVGIVQVNFTVPYEAELGVQNVVVSVSGVASAGAKLTITE